MSGNKIYSKKSDEVLMSLIQSSDSKAFDELYDRYAVILLNFFYRKLYQDRELANDFLQDFFIKIINHSEKFDASKNFGSWALKIAYNMCKNEYRKNTNKLEDINIDIIKNIPYFNDFQFDYDMDLFKTKLSEKLSEMSSKHQEIFRLRHIELHTIKEITVLLNTSEGTVKSRLFYCMKELAQKLQLFNSQSAEYYEK